MVEHAGRPSRSGFEPDESSDAAVGVVATIFLPITFITGVFGMNFKVQPWVDTNVWFWLFVMACMVAVI